MCSSIYMYLQHAASSPVKWEVMKRKEEPNKVKERPTAPFVLMMVTGLVAKLAEEVAEGEEGEERERWRGRAGVCTTAQRLFG